MWDNIMKQQRNMDKVQDVNDNATTLRGMATRFDTTTNQLKWYERRRNLVVTLVLAVGGFLLLAIIIAILVYIFR